VSEVYPKSGQVFDMVKWLRLWAHHGGWVGVTICFSPTHLAQKST